MTISFHCAHCGKKIEAPDNAGGKWGKCPRCHNKLYVPSADTGEELKLAPIDETDETKQQRLMAETYKLAQDILLEKETPAESTNAAPTGSKMSDKELTKNIILYLRQMADGELEQAETTVKSIMPSARKAAKIIDEIALSEMPEPELADVPQQVLSGLIRTLRSKIS